MAKFQTLLLYLIILFYTSSSLKIFEQIITRDEVVRRVNAYNEWHKKNYPLCNKVELRIRDDGQLGVFALEDIQV